MKIYRYCWPRQVVSSWSSKKNLIFLSKDFGSLFLATKSISAIHFSHKVNSTHPHPHWASVIKSKNRKLTRLIFAWPISQCAVSPPIRRWSGGEPWSYDPETLLKWKLVNFSTSLPGISPAFTEKTLTQVQWMPTLFLERWFGRSFPYWRSQSSKRPFESISNLSFRNSSLPELGRVFHLKKVSRWTQNYLSDAVQPD